MDSNQTKNAAAVELGRLGGKAGRGAAKRRSREQYQAAALKRWLIWRLAKQSQDAVNKPNHSTL